MPPVATNKKIKISIVVPLYIYNDRFKQDFQNFLDIDYPDYEIIIVSDKLVDINSHKVKVIYTNKPQTGPAEKRDVALSQCLGEVCAYIDDDAYPHKEWLTRAVKHFDDAGIAAVGGPGVTPDQDSFLEKAGGAVYSSVLGSGSNIYRFIPRKQREVDDYPAYNLLVRKSVLDKIGGYGSTFYGGEDTKLCLAIIQAGYKIIYDPSVLVYHHRRPLFKAHLKQVYNVGVHRGYFVKAYPDTSFRVIYFLPLFLSIFFISLIVAAIFNKLFAVIFFYVLIVALLLNFFSVIISGNKLILALLASVGIVATHLTYGIAFFRGLTLTKLER